MPTMPPPARTTIAACDCAPGPQRAQVVRRLEGTSSFRRHPKLRRERDAVLAHGASSRDSNAPRTASSDVTTRRVIHPKPLGGAGIYLKNSLLTTDKCFRNGPAQAVSACRTVK